MKVQAYSGVNVDTSSHHGSLPVSETSSQQQLQSRSPSTPSLAPATIPTIQAQLSPPGSFLSTDIVGSKAIYEIIFVTSTTGVIKKIEMTFPSGTDISGANIIERLGIGGGTVTKAGTTVTLNIQNAVSVPAGTYIRLELVNIKNPQFPFPNYQVTVTTRNSANGLIDGPTPSTAYNIKQIGRNDIAESAIIGPKIADNTITSTKPAESFMKQVHIFDTAAGNAVGWNPDGATTVFTISPAPGVTGGGSNFIAVMAGSSGVIPSNCDVPWGGTSFEALTLRCDHPPGECADLNYLSVHIPNQNVS